MFPVLSRKRNSMPKVPTHTSFKCKPFAHISGCIQPRVMLININVLSSCCCVCICKERLSLHRQIFGRLSLLIVHKVIRGYISQCAQTADSPNIHWHAVSSQGENQWEQFKWNEIIDIKPCGSDRSEVLPASALSWWLCAVWSYQGQPERKLPL